MIQRIIPAIYGWWKISQLVAKLFLRLIRQFGPTTQTPYANLVVSKPVSAAERGNMNEAVKEAFRMKFSNEDFVRFVTQNRIDLSGYLKRPGNPLKPTIQVIIANHDGLTLKSAELDSEKLLTKSFFTDLGRDFATNLKEGGYASIFSVSYRIHKSYFVAFQTIDGRSARLTIKLANTDQAKMTLDLMGKKTDELADGFFDGVDHTGGRDEPRP